MRVLARILPIRPGEGVSAWLMFSYSFLAMASYNIVKPVTRSTFITDQGPDNLPYVLLAASVLIGIAMHVYTGVVGRLPRHWVVPATQLGMVAALLGFWALFRAGVPWASVAFYLFGLILGLLLISQFWTLANDIYDARQARRVFGFIGGGASLGGAAGAGFTSLAVGTIGPIDLLPVSALVLLGCVATSMALIRRHPDASVPLAPLTRGVGGGEAIRLLTESRHLQVITLVIGFAAIGATFIEQQLNMAAALNRTSIEGVTRFLADVTVYVSLAGFIIQVALTGRIHRSFGLVVALLMLPVSLGATAGIILLNGALWAPAAARVLEGSLRYTIDKTTREMLFLPLPAELKHRAKPFVDVTMDRFARAVGAVALLVLIKPWGLGLGWQQISWASLVVMAAWIVFALIARQEYRKAFRRSLEAHEFEPATVRFDVADASTVETLVAELARPDDDAVLYAIEMLETLGRHERLTPLLLHHDSPRVRARALVALVGGSAATADQWLPTARRLLQDDHDPDVRAAAVRAVAALGGGDGSLWLRRYLDDDEPRVAAAAAADLADGGAAGDIAASEQTLSRLAATVGPAAASGRRQVAAALAGVRNPSFHSLLIPLIHDPDDTVAAQAIASARALGVHDALFVPALVSRLGHRYLKSEAREALVSYGPGVVGILAHVMRDEDEPLWVRRHVPGTLAAIPSREALDALAGVLDDADGFLRYKAIVALESLRRDHPDLALPSDAVSRQIVRETARYYTHLSLRHNLVESDASHGESLLARALADKLDRTLDRIFRLLGLLLPWRDVAAARYAIDGADTRARAAALEYLDNALPSTIRRRVMPILDTTPVTEKVRHANRVLKSRPRDVPDTVAQLVHDDDPVVAASAVRFMVSAGLVDGMRSDLEFIWSHRGAERLVGEAARWVLHEGARTDPAASAAPPVVELANRLRAIPLFAFVSIDELFRTAQFARLVRLGPGTLYRQGAPAGEVLFLLEGEVQVAGIDPAPATVRAPAALNLVDTLEGRPLRHAVQAAEPVRGLSLDAVEFITMLTDNIATAQGLFRMLLVSPGALDWSLGLTARPKPAGGAIDPVEKATLLRESPLFNRATLEQLQLLTAAAEDVRLVEGDVIWGDAVEPALYHVLDGEVTIATSGASDLVAGAGSTIGAAETLTGASPDRRATVTGGGQALRIGRDALFDVLADHGDLLQSVFSGVLGAGRTEWRR